jgi:hypothetical protein
MIPLKMDREAIIMALQNRITRTCLAIQWLILTALVVLVVVFRNFVKVAYFLRTSNTTVLEEILNGSLSETGRGF